MNKKLTYESKIGSVFGLIDNALFFLFLYTKAVVLIKCLKYTIVHKKFFVLVIFRHINVLFYCYNETS